MGLLPETISGTANPAGALMALATSGEGKDVQAKKKKERALAREKYIKSLAGREDSIWQKVDERIDSKQPAKYDEAVKLLVDLRDLNKMTEKENAFNQKLKTICENHSRKSTFLNRLRMKGLIG